MSSDFEANYSLLKCASRPKIANSSLKFLIFGSSRAFKVMMLVPPEACQQWLYVLAWLSVWIYSCHRQSNRAYLHSNGQI